MQRTLIHAMRLAALLLGLGGLQMACAPPTSRPPTKGVEVGDTFPGLSLPNCDGSKIYNTQDYQKDTSIKLLLLTGHTMW